jgi:hypothetical protein
MMLARQGLVDVEGIQSGNVCVGCMGHLRDELVPRLTLNGPYHIRDGPDTLRELTFLEALLVTICFPLLYTVELRGLRDGQADFEFNAVPQANVFNVSSLPVKANDVRRLLHLHSKLEACKEASLLSAFRVCRAHIEGAIAWLCVNNPYYEDIRLNAKELTILPTDGVPDWVVQEFAVIKGEPSCLRWGTLS